MKTSDTTELMDTKAISYRGGLVEFVVPASWREEYDPSGGGTFYEDRPDSGTLRLNVLSFSSDNEPAEQMARCVFPPGSYELTPNGFPLRFEIVEAEERGTKLHLHSWSVAVPVSPNSVRLAVFRYAIVAGQEQDPKIRNELAVVDKSVRSATYSQAPGQVGPYTQQPYGA